MTRAQDFYWLSQYNYWMNEKLYRAGCSLNEADLIDDRGAFFGSVLGTLNHIMVGDILWLKRFAMHPGGFEALQPVLQLPQPTGLDQVLYNNLTDWWQARRALDQRIIDWCRALDDSDLDHKLSYQNRLGQPHVKPFSLLLTHFFNHQTHHRGQASTLLCQMGVDIGATDLPVIIPEEI